MTFRDLLFGPTTPSRATDLGLLVLRVGVGLSLAFAHGLGKLPPSAGFIETTAEMGFPLPTLFAWAAALSEFAGGLLVVIGLATRPAAFFAGFTMATAFFIRHGGDAFGSREKPFLFLVVFVALVVMGAGRYSVDGWIRRREGA
jgi:putative oxidoreductase